jgi:hypothetical protein
VKVAPIGSVSCVVTAGTTLPAEFEIVTDAARVQGLSHEGSTL